MGHHGQAEACPSGGGQRPMGHHGQAEACPSAAVGDRGRRRVGPAVGQRTDPIVMLSRPEAGEASLLPYPSAAPAPTQAVARRAWCRRGQGMLRSAFGGLSMTNWRQRRAQHDDGGVASGRSLTGVRAENVAERVGFEPTRDCSLRALQARLIVHSSTSPRGADALRSSYPTPAFHRDARSRVAGSDTGEGGGEGGIRTHGGLAATPLFESGTINHSDTSPIVDYPSGRHRTNDAYCPRVDDGAASSRTRSPRTTRRWSY